MGVVASGPERNSSRSASQSVARAGRLPACLIASDAPSETMMRVAAALVTAGLLGCATARPVLYPNEKYQQVGSSGADRDIAECSELADQAGATPGAGKAGQVAKDAGVGTVGGAAAGAVG